MSPSGGWATAGPGVRRSERRGEAASALSQALAPTKRARPKSAQLKEKFETEAQRLREQTAVKERDMDVRVATLRQELEEKQRQRSEATEQSARLAEKISQLEKALEEQNTQLQEREGRIAELEVDTERLKRDLTRIMGNLSKW